MALEVEQQRLGNRHRAAAQHQLGGILLDEGTIAQKRVVAIDDQRVVVRATAQARERIGQDGEAECCGELRHRPGQRRIVLRATNDQAALGACGQRRQLRDGFGAGGAQPCVHAHIGRTSGAGSSGLGGQRRVRQQRLAERTVKVYRPGWPAQRRRNRAPGDGAYIA
jgi:hypothetical protein